MTVKRFSMALGLILLSAQMAQANYEKGQEALDRNEAAAAIEEWRPVAKRGDAKAQYSLGQIFEKGANGVDADLIEAYAWFKLAAAQDLEGANDAIERLRKSMSPEEVQQAQARSLAALGFWYRDFTGQDETAFQKIKATSTSKKQETAQTEDTLAAQRAAAQRELIAQRKADAEAKTKALEESRQASIYAAQAAAEEAKRQAELREQKIQEQRRAIAQKDEKQSETQLDDARTRLAALMAKQNNAVPTSEATAVVVQPQAASKQLVAQKSPKSAEKMGVGTASVETKSDAQLIAAPKVAIVPTPKPVPTAQKAALTTAPDPVKSPTISEVSEPSLTKAKSDALASLKTLDGLDKNAVVEIFEQAKIADLDSDAARVEIDKSLVRIEALKWSLISGAKGDNAAPKMNKVLMSKMTSVQIAEANRLAGQWLIDRQKKL